MMIRVLDSTLREGEQTPGVYMDSHVKQEIARLLDEVGVDLIEAGHPMVSDDIRIAVRDVAQLDLNATIVAHARSLRGDIEAAVETGVGMIGLFYCVSDDRLDTVFRTSLREAIDQITDSIRYAKRLNPKLIIRYTPEDTVRSPFLNVVEAASEAVAAGADVISVADTTGYMMPGVRSMYDYVSRLREALNARNADPIIAVHCHNDRGLALANALDGCRAGATIVDATVLRLGERTGITDLAELLFNLNDGFGENRWNLPALHELYRIVSKYSYFPISKNHPLVGENAFTHNAGVHTHAWIKKNSHYESVDPAVVGRRSSVCLDNMSGVASVKFALERMNVPDINDRMILCLLNEIKAIGRRGRAVDEAELALLVRSYRQSLTLLRRAE